MSEFASVFCCVASTLLLGVWIVRGWSLGRPGPTGKTPVPAISAVTRGLYWGSLILLLGLYVVAVLGGIPWWSHLLGVLGLSLANRQTARPAIRQLAGSFFPTGRYQWQWQELWPLLLFLAVYGGAIWSVLALSSLQLLGLVWFSLLAVPLVIWWIAERGLGGRQWLGLLWRLLIVAGLIVGLCELARRLDIPGQLIFSAPENFALIVVSVWVWWMFRNGWHGLSRERALQALFIRLAIVGLFVALLAEPRSVRVTDKLAVIYAVDISDSIHRSQVEAALGFVARTVSEKPRQDQAGWIAFGSNAAVEIPPAESGARLALMSNPNDIQFNSRIDRDATNIEQALSLAAAVIDENVRGRIVLISDGVETAGDLQPVLQQLRSRGIAVDVLPIDYVYENEVWVERMELPPSVKIGEAYQGTVIVSALQPTPAKLVIEENGQVYREFDVELKEGKNRFDVPFFLSGPGYYEYVAKIRVPEGADGRSENNEGVGYVFVQGEGKVLLVTDPLREDDRDFEQLARAIREGERLVETLDAYDLPRDPLQLMNYDCVIFANVPHDAFDESQLRAVHDAVYNQGIGFLMVGGGNSFGPGGYHRTVIEDALPVTMDITKKKVLPKGALAIILHTCEFPEGNTWAKRITKQAIKVLGEQDEVGVLAYTGRGEEWIFDLTPAGNYDQLVPLINGAQIGDMPTFGGTMQMGLTALQKSDAAAKHMIIISDGDPQPAPPSVMQGFKDSQISVSTVAIFPHGGTEIGLLRTMAEATGGRYYFPSDPNQLPSIFIKEAKTLKRTMIQEKTFTPQGGGFPSSVLEGIDAVPQLHGFVLTSLRENALTENILCTISDDAEPGETDPVLAIWRYGLGTTAAFTSSLSNQWARDWVRWEDYRAFVKQLLLRISRTERTGQLRLWTYHSGGEGVIMVEDFAPEESFLDVNAQVRGPGGMELTVPLKQVGSRRYQGTFPVQDKGRFQITALGTDAQREDRAHGGFIVSYSPEFLKFTSNWKTLRNILETTGGTELTAETPGAEIFNRRQPKESSQPVFDWFLVLLACLIPLDVAVRRVQLDWQVIAQALGLGRKAETTATMGALLARKQSVAEQLQQRREERPLPTAGTHSPLFGNQTSTRQVAPQSAPTSRKPETPPADDQTTTSRLLDLKRKRDQDPK